MEQTRLLAVLTVIVGLAACSSGAHPAARPTTTGTPGTPTTGLTTRAPSGPSGPAATLTGPITAGHIIEPAAPASPDLRAADYIEEEWFASGTASAYIPARPLGIDGHWSVTADSPAPYRTRLVVRRPADPARFNGTVLVEWFNVTAVEAAPDWSYLGDELVRSGTAYVGVSMQALGVNGGTGLISTPGSSSSGLRTAEPTRYGSLVHPGDRYAFDMLSQIGRALRGSGPFVADTVKRIIADGESQSAFYLTTYVDAVAATARVFDGYFIHSRGGTAAPLGAGNIVDTSVPVGVRIRDDLDVPVFVFETETDLGPLLHYGPARQPDTDRIRVWEVAGTAHVDAFLIGGYANVLQCAAINTGPQHYVEEAALYALEQWITAGTPPPSPPPLQLTSPDATTVATDSVGNALGGVRTPAVDTPVAVLSGAAAPGASTLCSLFGSSRPLTPAELTARYGNRPAYLAAFTAALDRAIAGRYLLAADRPELLAFAGLVGFPS